MTRRNADAALLAALASGRSIADAAKLAGISESTARRRCRDQAFADELAKVHAEALQQAMALLTEGTVAASMTLRTLLFNAPPTVRLGAARSVIELGETLRKSGDYEKRLSALEQQFGQPADSNVIDIEKRS
jgi:hypothetical protein